MKCEECKNRLTVAGQAFTKYICSHCFYEIMYHNTSTPKICPKCSENYNRCERCLKILK